MDFPFQNNKNDLIWTRRCGEAGWLKQKILNPTCQAITSPNMNLTQQTSVSNEKITGNKEYSIVSKYTLHAKFCLQINARVCLSNCRWILFFATITFAAAGWDATIHYYFSGFVKVMKHIHIYHTNPFLWIERTQSLNSSSSVLPSKKFARKMAIRCKYLTCVWFKMMDQPLSSASIKRHYYYNYNPMQYRIILHNFFVKMYPTTTQLHTSMYVLFGWIAL